MNIEVEKRVRAKMAFIDTQEEFDRTITVYQASESPDKYEAIELLNKTFPLFAKGEDEIQAIAREQYFEARADTDDIGN